jgi:hypothetical protein
MVEECGRADLIKREQWWIDNSGCLNNKVGYNINILADRTILTPSQCEKIRKNKLGHSVSQKTRDKISKSLSGKNCGVDHSIYGKYPVIQMDQSGKIMGRYGNLVEASKFTGIPTHIIKGVYSGRTNIPRNINYRKYVWKRIYDEQNTTSS